MGRHSHSTDVERPLPLPARVGALGAIGVVVLGLAVLVAPRDALARLPWSADGTCPAQTVEIVVEPELQETVQGILAPLQGTALPDGGCVRTRARAEDAVETVASSELLPPDRAPQVWIPDSEVWVPKVTRWRTQASERFASSPVVVATSRNAAERLGWTKGSPSWNEALRGPRPVAVPGIRTDADGLYALLALWQSLGKNSAADTAIVNVVLGADRGEVPTVDEALAVARSGSVNSPLVPVTEQAVAATNRLLPHPALTAVYPREGSPMLTYPVIRVTTTERSPDLRAATDLVLERLGSDDARAAARRQGFRGPDGSPGAGDGIYTGAVRALAGPGPGEIDRVIERVEQLGRPTRILCLIDASLSMRSKLRDGLTRVQLSAAAARLGASVLPDSASVGAWVFASHMRGDQDWREIAPIAPLGSVAARGQSHRALLTQLSQNPDRYLHGGGTSLYDTTIAAVRAMHSGYDPRASNGIILLSDGANEDSTGATLDQVLAEIRRLNAGPQQVMIYTAGLGPDADYRALRAIAQASGGWAYQIDSAGEGQAALLDGLRRNAERLVAAG